MVLLRRISLIVATHVDPADPAPVRRRRRRGIRRLAHPHLRRFRRGRRREAPPARHLEMLFRTKK